MSDEMTDPAVEMEAAPEQPAQAEPDWKAEARKWETRAKENKDAASRLQELEDAQKTEQERLAEQLTAASSERDLLRGELMRERIGRKHGLPDNLVGRLRGDDEEQLDADAQELAALIGDNRPELPTRPQERLRSGSAPSVQADTRSPQELADEVIKRSRGY